MNSVCTLCCDGCKEHGERVERDRIIALLEAQKPCRMKDTHHDIGLCSCLAISLIEGGNDYKFNKGYYRRQGKVEGAYVERERIIKLLEGHRISLKDITTQNWVGLWHDAIALIKGEK